MNVFSTILLVLAFICFIVDAFHIPTPPNRVNLTALGLALWVLNSLVVIMPR